MTFKQFMNENYQYSSVQVVLPDNIRTMMIEYGAKISDFVLTEKGRESNPHITVKYGIHSSSSVVMDAVILPTVIRAVMGKIDVFRCDGYDVVKVNIHSPDMEELNSDITSNIEVTNTHATYEAHATIAYVLPGEGDVYIGDDYFKGMKLEFDEIEFSSNDGSTTKIKL